MYIRQNIIKKYNYSLSYEIIKVEDECHLYKDYLFDNKNILDNNIKKIFKKIKLILIEL